MLTETALNRDEDTENNNNDGTITEIKRKIDQIKPQWSPAQGSPVSRANASKVSFKNNLVSEEAKAPKPGSKKP